MRLRPEQHHTEPQRLPRPSFAPRRKIGDAPPVAICEIEPNCGGCIALCMTASCLARLGGPGAGPEALEARLAALIVAVGRDRDRGAFAELFALAAPRCKAFCLARGTPDAVAEEIAQEALAAVWRDAPAFDPARGSGAFSWLYGLARDEWLRALGRYLGRTAAERERLAEPSEPPPDRDVAAERRARAERLRAAMGRLSGHQVLLLRDVFVRGLSHGAIARVRRMPLGTVKARLRRALYALRDAAFRDEDPRM